MEKVDWDKLNFDYMPVCKNVRYTYRDGTWGEGRISDDCDITLSVASSCLHYGQTAFEGLKAFQCKDGNVRVFRPQENAERLRLSMGYILAPQISEEMFIEAIKTVVRENLEFVPPYGCHGSLYIRPLVIGTSPKIGVAPSDDYEFIVLATPVGSYYKGGLKPIDALVMEDFDRAAPRGTGHIKIGGNYAAGLTPGKIAKERGCDVILFLDSQSRQYIDEFGTSNFIGITESKKYVTPDSASILDSITNKSLRQIAIDSGLTVEQRKIHVDELTDFIEVGACGTAVIITPIRRIFYGEKMCSYGDECGPILLSLYNSLTGIQNGELPDTHNWMMDI